MFNFINNFFNKEYKISKLLDNQNELYNLIDKMELNVLTLDEFKDEFILILKDNYKWLKNINNNDILNYIQNNMQDIYKKIILKYDRLIKLFVEESVEVEKDNIEYNEYLSTLDDIIQDTDTL